MSVWQSIADAVGKFFRPGPVPSPVPEPPPPPAPSWVPPPPPSTNVTIVELLAAHNAERLSRKVPALAIREQLTLAAQWHADWMAANRDMNHNERPGTPKFSAVRFDQRISKTGYMLSAGGENVAAGQRSTQAVMADWMKSPPHRQSILNKGYWNVGFGVATDAHGYIYWCAVFATPLVRRDNSEPTRAAVRLPEGLVEV